QPGPWTATGPAVWFPDGMQDWGHEDEIERVAATMDAEVRAEQAAYEAMALQAEWRARTLADVARELVVRGDHIEVRAAGQSFSGTVVHAGADYAVLDTRRGPVDLVLTRGDHLRVTQRVREGGRAPGRGAKTLRARLTEHEVSGQRLCLLTADGEVEGTLDAVAVDHVLVATRRGQVVVPQTAVVAVWPSAG
ncbi:MAG TPA: DUF2642 domain-containing protein, partial [Euzebya sp.]|nr:DUF2642 domain-containing protein [Euzebya sp.]